MINFIRMKHSNIIYDPLTKMTLIDNSLIKALEIAQARKIRIKKNKELAAEKQKSFEMSESHECKPFLKNK
jgi:hypothetical protein